MKIYRNTPLLLSAGYGIIRSEKNKARVGPTQGKQGKENNDEDQNGQGQGGAGNAQKGARAHILINKLAADNKAVVWRYAELDAIALELRHLAFQIRVLKNAKTATEEA